MKLLNQRVVVTRPRLQASEFINELQKAGAIPVCFPTIEISAIMETGLLDRALTDLQSYDWLILTSANGVRAVWRRLAVLRLERLPERLRVAAIGPKTAETLQDLGIVPDFIPEEYVAEEISPGLGDLRGKKVLLPRAENARQALPERIRELGGVAEEITAYHTLPAQPDGEAIQALRSGVDILTFTSSSTVENFIYLCNQSRLDTGNLTGSPLVACIGPITAETARRNGLEVRVIARQYTSLGLLQALKEYDGS